MGAQCCCSFPQKQITNEIVLDVKGSLHTLSKKSVNNEQYVLLDNVNEIKEQYEDFEVIGDSPQDVTPKDDQNGQQCKVFAQSESKVDTLPKCGIKKKLTVSSIGTVKLGADVFVNLKQGSIHKYYTTGEVLGQGAYGKVWKVTHKNTGMIRAMKQLKKNSLIVEEQQRLFAEMNILKNLDHPHIVKLYELYQDQKNYYLITEYLSGGELFDRIKSMTYFSEKKAAEFIRQILLAVVYCHEQKIVHRDLKPENILFVNESSNSQLKVIDFGTSRKYDTEKKMTKKLGTAYYIAPEVLKQDYNEKCDVWSCGVILYILLCGYPPFTGKTEKDIMHKVSEGKFKFDQEDWGFISEEAKNLITKMLQVNPNQRISAKQALYDPWIDKHNLNEKVNQIVLQNLQKFQAKSIFTQAVLSYIACQMTSQQEQDELIKTFQTLDQDKNGILSKDELIEGYNLVLKDRELAIKEVNKILEIVDLNQSGQVDFSEFLMAAINQEKLVSLERVKAAFKIFDANDDGKISKEELELMIGSIDEELWRNYRKRIHRNTTQLEALIKFYILCLGYLIKLTQQPIQQSKLPTNFVEKVLNLELDVESNVASKEEIQELFELYSQGIEYYSLLKFERFTIFTNKIQAFLMKPYVNKMFGAEVKQESKQIQQYHKQKEQIKNNIQFIQQMDSNKQVQQIMTAVIDEKIKRENKIADDFIMQDHKVQQIMLKRIKLSLKVLLLRHLKLDIESQSQQSTLPDISEQGQDIRSGPALDKFLQITFQQQFNDLIKNDFDQDDQLPQQTTQKQNIKLKIKNLNYLVFLSKNHKLKINFILILIMIHNLLINKIGLFSQEICNILNQKKSKK